MKNLIIVIGTSGSGKTTYCNRMIEGTDYPCVRFDCIYNYEKEQFDFEALEKLGNSDSNTVLIDGFVFGVDPGLENTLRIIQPDHVEIHCVYTNPEILHTCQVAKHEIEPLYRNNTIGNETWNRECNLTNSNSFLRAALRMGNSVVVDRAVFIYRDVAFNFISRGCDASEMCKMVEDEILWLIDTISGDPNYQTVEIYGKQIREGYSKTWKHWNDVKTTGIDFTGKEVCDIGCFNGYVLIKISQSGAKRVIGIDENGAAIRLARRITNLNHIWNCEYLLRSIGKDENVLDRHYDVIVMMNTLHHIRDMKGMDQYYSAIADVCDHANEIVWEVHAEELPDVERICKEKGFIERSRVDTCWVSKYGRRWVVWFSRS